MARSDSIETRSGTTEREPAEFFSLNATYLVAPDSTPGQLMNDTACLLDSAIDVLAQCAESIGGQGWAALYLIRQAQASSSAAHSMLYSEGKIKD